MRLLERRRREEIARGDGQALTPFASSAGGGARATYFVPVCVWSHTGVIGITIVSLPSTLKRLTGDWFDYFLRR